MPTRLCMIRPLPTSLISFPTLFPDTSWVTLAFLLSWELPKHVPASGHLHMLFPLPRILFSLDSYTICVLAPFRSLSNTISSSRPFLTILCKKAFHHFIFFSVLIITCHCIIYCVAYWFITCHSTRIEAACSLGLFVFSLLPLRIMLETLFFF